MAIDRVASLAVDIVINARRFNNFMFRTGPQGTKNLAGSVNSLRNSILGIGLAASAFLLLRKVMGLATDAARSIFDAFVKLEKQIIDVQKIAKAPTFKAIADSFLDIGKNVSGVDFQTISDTMQSAARAGIRLDQGLQKFTETALRLQQVSGDIGSREAAEGLAALIINFGESTDRAVNLASGLDALSDAFLTTTGEIIKTSARLSGFAQATNMSAEDLNALSAALLSTKQTATVVRTSIIKVISALSNTQKVEEFAKIMGMSREEFVKFTTLIETDPVEALKLFSQILSSVPFDKQIEALIALGASSARVSSTIQVLKENLNQLEKAQIVSSEETERGTAVLEKSFLVIQSAHAQVVDLGKAWEEFKASLVGTQPIIDAIAGGLQTLIDTANQMSRGGFGEKSFAPISDEELSKEIDRRRKELAELDKELEKKGGVGAFVRGAAAGGFGGGVRQFIIETGEAVTSVSGQRVRLQKEFDALVEIAQERRRSERDTRDKQDQANQKILEDAAALIRNRREQREKEKKAAEEFVKNLPKLTGTSLERGLDRLEQQYEMAAQKFNKFTFFIEDAAVGLGNFADEVEAAKEALIEREIGKTVDDLAGTIIPKLGKFGEAFGIFEDAQQFTDSLNKLEELGAISEEQADDLFGTAKQIMLQQLGELAKPEKQSLATFSSLKDISFRAFKERKQEKMTQAQLDAAKNLVKLLESDEATQKIHTQHLQKIAENLQIQ